MSANTLIAQETRSNRTPTPVTIDVPNQPKTSHFKDKDPIAVEVLERVVPAPIVRKVEKLLAKGETIYFKGSLIQQFLRMQAINPADTDVDCIAVGEETIKNLRSSKTQDKKNTYKLFSEPVEGVKLEISDGEAIKLDIVGFLKDMVKQLNATQLETLTPEKRHAVERARSTANKIFTDLESDPNNIISINGFLHEKGIAIKATLVNGKLECSVFDPKNTLAGEKGANEIELNSQEELGFVPERLSQGIAANSIFRLVLEMADAYDGKLNTKSWVALSTLRMITRLPREAVNGLILAAYTLAGLYGLDESTGTLKYDPRTLNDPLLSFVNRASNDMYLIRRFLELNEENKSFTSHSPLEFLQATGEKTMDDFMRKLVQAEFAKTSYLNTESAFFNFFSHFPEFMKYISPTIADDLWSYRSRFNQVPQTSLEFHLRDSKPRALFFNIAPQLYSVYVELQKQYLGFFENVIKLCDRIYKPIPIQLKDKSLPLIRPINSPKNMSEVFGAMYVCLNKPSPSDEELNKLCNQWTQRGKITNYYMPTADKGFDKSVSPEMIRKAIAEMTAKFED